ncbi:MAG: SNF2-related protein [Candidatus Eisenbacteria bacterium]
MSTAYQRYEIGAKVYHEDYGEGMVVEVRPRQFFDILEVAFADGVKRLNSNHPKISDTPPQTQTPAKTTARSRRSRKSHRDPSRRMRSADPLVAVDAANDAPEAVVEEAPSEADDGAAVDETAANEMISFFGDPEVLRFDAGSLAPFQGPDASPDADEAFVRHIFAERLSLTRGFEKLLCLPAVQDLEQYDFQIQAVLRVLRNLRGRAILADEVGLGKTIEAGLILKEYQLRGLVRRALVLTPVSLMSQWREELRHKFDLPFEIHSRGQRWDSYPWMIASLDTAKTEKNRDEIGEAGFDILVVDEAHRLRNHLTQGWKFVDALSLKYLLLLTATPVQNDLRELYNLVTLLKPGTLGTYREFRKQFMVRGDKRLPKDPTKLAATLSEVMIRTSRSSTSLTFPRREVRIQEFRMSDEERKLYDGTSRFVREVLADPDLESRSRWHLLLLLLQKEMGSSAPAAVRTLERAGRVFHGSAIGKKIDKLVDIGHAIETHTKRDGLLDLVRDEPDEKFLVFTQFRTTLEFLETGLREAGFDPVVFYGGLTPAEKDRAIEAFRGKKRILLSTEAGGEGRNLQFCRTVVNYDLPWNPMRIEQRIGRVHRLGQTRDTLIWNFTARDTVEDYVLAILHQKIQMFELVIGEMDMVLGQWSDRDGFEHEIFRIWTEHRTARERQQAYGELAEDLMLARTRYERIRQYDDRIFTPMNKAHLELAR